MAISTSISFTSNNDGNSASSLSTTIQHLDQSWLTHDWTWSITANPSWTSLNQLRQNPIHHPHHQPRITRVRPWFWARAYGFPSWDSSVSPITRSRLRADDSLVHQVPSGDRSQFAALDDPPMNLMLSIFCFYENGSCPGKMDGFHVFFHVFFLWTW